MKLNHVTNEKAWVKNIGQFIFDFATLEEAMHVIITSYLKSSLLNDSFITSQFDKRWKLFVKIMNMNVLVRKRDKELLEQMNEQMKILKPVRDLLAHNGITYGIYQNNDGDVLIREEIAGKRKNISRSYAELVDDVALMKKFRKNLEKIMEHYYIKNLSRHVAGK
jgi:hypothetical protein